ncbi:MAG: sigma-70 family RNA polymerase sigma factor [Pirellulales bacterium]|nr:sigma-70 family RNA polymerase sigma factor [Pirellulales bacterium]
MSPTTPAANDERQQAWVEHALAQYERRLTIFAWRIVGERELARDVVQDTFLKLAQQDRAALDGHLGAWLYTVCRRRALDVCRKESRMQTVLDSDAIGQPVADKQISPLERQEEAGRALRLVAALPPQQQEAVRLKFEHELSYREIAEVMEISVSHVGVLLHHALRRLRSELTPQ